MHTHATRKRRVDVHRLTGFLDLFVIAHGLDRAHVVQTVGEFDQGHAQIARRRHEQLAEVFRLLSFVGINLKVGEFGYAIDKISDLTSEPFFDNGEGRARVLNRIMKERGDNRRVIHLLFSEDTSNGYGVGKIGLTGMAKLALMGLRPKYKRISNKRCVRFRVIGADQRDQIVRSYDQIVRSDHAGRPPYSSKGYF